MCFHDKPTINDEAWRAPKLADGDVLLHDEPGRCGGLDHHSHHFRVVKSSSSVYLLVRHGGGDERIRLFPHKALPSFFEAMDSTARYWILATIYAAYRDGEEDGRGSECAMWRKAAVERRIKTRKQRGTDRVKVTIEPALRVQNLDS